MRPLARRLETAGFTVHNIGYPSRRYPPERLCRIIAGEIADRCPDGGIIHGVGHSLGALLLRAVAEAEVAERVGRLVLLAPPNGGSEIVDRLGKNRLFRALFGPSGVALGTEEGSFPNRLAPITGEVGVIAATRSINPLGSLLLPGGNDGAVAIARTAVEGMADYIELPSSHTFIMRAPETAAQVLHFLRHGRFAHS